MSMSPEGSMDAYDQPLWVFGYGSLMWRPGFPHEQTMQALLPGAHRSLCVYSWVHRGTQNKPGLVLGLDRGGACRGLAFQVHDRDRAEVVDYLREREQVTMVYLERYRQIKLADSRWVKGLCYLVDTDHAQYAGRLEKQAMLDVVRDAVGRSGENWEYVVNSASAITRLGLRDPVMQWLSQQLIAHREAGNQRSDQSPTTA